MSGDRTTTAREASDLFLARQRKRDEERGPESIRETARFVEQSGSIMGRLMGEILRDRAFEIEEAS